MGRSPDEDGWERLLRPAREAPDAASFRAMVRAARAEAQQRLPRAGGPEDAARAASAFAEVAVKLALEDAIAHARRRFGAPRRADGEPSVVAVVALGAFAAREVGLGDRLAVLFVHDSDDGATDALGGLGRSVALHDFWSDVTAGVFERLAGRRGSGPLALDGSLRPEGTGGPATNSAEALEAYYEAFGSAEERLAWQRARVVAGDPALGQAVRDALSPFWRPRTVGPELVDALAVLEARRADAGDLDRLRLVTDGMLLLHGGRHPDLSRGSTPEVLAGLASAGVMEAGEAASLADAWRDLVAARITGEPDDQPTRREEVARALAAFLGAPTAESEPLEALADLSLPRARREAAAEALGFRTPALACGHVRRMARQPHGPFHAREVGRGGGTARALLEAVTQAADPDLALAHLAELVARVGPRGGPLLEQLADDPGRRGVLIDVFGASPWVSRLLLADPDRIERLLWSGGEPAERSGVVIEPGGDPVAAARRTTLDELTRIGVLALSGVIDGASVERQLSALADAVVQHLTAGWPGGDGVVALGGWGAGRLGFGLRLPLVVVGSTEDATARSARLVRDLRAAGPWQVDTSRRPGGPGSRCAIGPDGLVRHAPRPRAWASARAVVGEEPVCRAVAAIRGDGPGADADLAGRWLENRLRLVHDTPDGLLRRVASREVTVGDRDELERAARRLGMVPDDLAAALAERNRHNAPATQARPPETSP